MELYYESSNGIIRHASTEDELYHYGVKGMKWGIRRARKQLSKGTAESREAGYKALTKHKGKTTKKIGSLDKKYDKLQKKRDKQIRKSDVKAAKMDAKAAKYRKKANGRFTSFKKSQKLEWKANKLEVKANSIKTKSALTQAKIDKNRNMREAFNKGLSEIDRELVNAGRRYLEED